MPTERPDEYFNSPQKQKEFEAFSEEQKQASIGRAHDEANLIQKKIQHTGNTFKNIDYDEIELAIERERDSKQPKQAIEFYLQKRREVIRDASLLDNQKYELIEYYDRRRAQMLISDASIYTDYFNATYQRPMERSLIKDSSRALKKLIGKEHFIFSPGTEFVVAADKSSSGIPYRARISDIHYLDKGNTQVILDIDVIDSRKPSLKHTVAMYLDKALEEARVAVIPEGLHITHPETHVKGLFSSAIIAYDAIDAVANLSQTSTYQPRPFFGNRITGDSVPPTGPMKPTKINETETPSLIGFRRRTTENTVANVNRNIQELIQNISLQERKALEDAGNGHIMMRLYSAEFGGKYGYLGTAAFNDDAAIKDILEQAQAAQNVMVTFEHAWRPPEIDQAAPGTPHRPHTRRLRGKVVVAVGKTLPNNERENIVAALRKEPGERSQEEEKILETFAQRFNLDLTELGLRTEIVSGIHCKDGKFQEGAWPIGLSHIYTK